MLGEREGVHPVADQVEHGDGEDGCPPARASVMGGQLDAGPDRDDEPADVGDEPKQREPAASADRLEEHDPEADEGNERHDRVAQAPALGEHVSGDAAHAESNSDNQDQHQDVSGGSHRLAPSHSQDTARRHRLRFRRHLRAWAARCLSGAFGVLSEYVEGAP